MFRMLIYDKENSEILAAMYHIISLMIAQNIVQNQYSLLPLKEGISNMLDHFTNLITAEKKALKARSFSANAIKHTTNVLKSLLTKNIPGIATGPFLDLVLQILGEKETCTLLHLDYLSLLTLQNQNETLLTYIESCTSQGGHFLQNNLDWLVHAQKCLEEIGSSGTRQTIIALKVSSLAGFLAFSKPSNSTTKDIGSICENVMAFIAKQIDDSNPALKDASSLTKEWTDCKLEMQATLSLFKALLDLSRISNPLEPSSTICKEVLENVLTALSYSPAQPNSFPHFIRQSRALTILKVFVYNIDMDWVDGFLLMAPPFSIAKTTASKSTFENSLALPSLDFTISKVVETIPRLKKYTKLIRDVDKSDITLLAMMQNPNSLFEIVQYAFWNARVGSLRLFTFLESIFPSLPKHHLVYENIDGSNQSMKGDGTSPTKSYRYNTKLTPTISDLEAFLAMMLLERQAACLDLCNSTKFEEFIFSTLKTNLWTPSEEACTFWNAVVSKYAHFNTLVEGITKKTSQLHSPSLVKCIENGVLQIRGESKDSKNFKDTYGLLGLFFLRSYVKESQDFWIPAKYYMEVYKRFESVVAQPEDKMAFTGLLSKILYEVGLVIDVKSLGNRVKEGVDLTVFDLKLCFDNVKRRSTSVNSSHLDFSKRVSFDTGIIHSSTSSSERIFSPQRLSLPAVDGKRNSSTVKSGLNSSTVKSGLESSPLVPKLAQKPILKKEVIKSSFSISLSECSLKKRVPCLLISQCPQIMTEKTFHSKSFKMKIARFPFLFLKQP